MPCDPSTSSTRPRSLLVALLAALLLVIVTLATCWPLLGHGYVEWDDPQNLFRNTRYNPPRWSALGWYWQNAEAGLYVPLTYTVWMAVAQVAYDDGDDDASPESGQEVVALNPRVFHAANVVVHVLAVLVVFALLRFLVKHDIAAAIGALVWAVHPVQVESVAWISGMKDLLGGLLSAAAILLYLKQAQLGSAAIDARQRQRRRQRRLALYLLAMLALALALISKPIAMIAPLIAGVLDWGILRRRPLVVVVAELAPWVVLALSIAIWTRIEQTSPRAYLQAPLHYRPIVAGDALAFYIRHTIAPLRLGLDYGRAPQVIGSNPLNLLWWLLPLGVAAALWLIRRRAWPVVIGAMIFLIGLLPVLGLTPFSAQFYSTVWDHYLYVPLIGIALAVAWLLSRVSPRVAAAVAVPLVLALAARSWLQTWHWRDTRTLFTHTLAMNPDSWLAHDNLAFVALANNEPMLAEHHIAQSMRLRPPDGEIYRNLGIARGQQGRFTAAEAALRKAVDMVPNDAASHYLLGEALAQLGKLEEAVEHLNEALRLEPSRTDARAALARVRAMQQAPTSSPSTSARGAGR